MNNSIDFKTEPGSDAMAIPKRIAFIKNRTSTAVRREEEEMVMTIPHLVIREAIAFALLVLVLALLSLAFNAPLEWIANPEHTPNPAKAPWYFLGLQELLHYFPPVVAGVLIPLLVVTALMVIPYFRVNIERQGLWGTARRRNLLVLSGVTGVLSILFLMYKAYAMLIPTLAVYLCMTAASNAAREKGFFRRLHAWPLSWWIMTWFVILVALLTAIGTLFRGPEWRWVWPWEGIY